jgi:phosphomethylpyrimidine synthase
LTQLKQARNNDTTKEMSFITRSEGIDLNLLKKSISDGIVVIPANRNHKNIKPIGIGSGLSIKINANIGTSKIKSDIDTELIKLETAMSAGADTVMDLSTGDDIDATRKTIIENCPGPLGTVPIYQTAIEAGAIEKMSMDTYLKVLRKNADDGVDFITIHAGVTRKAFPLIEKRVMKCVSRGGSFLLAWMKYNHKENFLYEHFDEVLAIAGEYDITISLGDGLRPGCIDDATDEAQIDELKTIGELAQRARDKGVQVIIEGPGHIPLNEIEKNVRLEKQYCANAPFYVLGPLPTDIAVGYDHIACAIGGALAGMHGADYLCYVTPKEHIGLPDIDDVREGVVVSKLAAHIADLANGNKMAREQDHRMGLARAAVDWEEMMKYAIDKKKYVEIRREECLRDPLMESSHYCSMCGPFCVFEVLDGTEVRGK